MTSVHAGSGHRGELEAAVRRTIATGSARVTYTMQANPPHLADYEHGKGVVDFRHRRSRVAYYAGEDAPHGSCLDQVIDGDVTFLRIGGLGAGWEEAELGDPDEFAASGDAAGFLDLLSAPGEVRLLPATDEIDGRPARHYALTIDAPRSSLRERLAGAFGVRGPTRFWLEAWVDAGGRVRRVAACDHEPDRDGRLRRGSVRTIVEFDDLGSPAPVEVPPADG